MPNKIKKYVTTGVTKPLTKDSVARTVTLVCIVEVKDQIDVRSEQFSSQKGKKRILSFVTEDVVVGTNTTLYFGLAVLSPTDVKLQEEVTNKWNAAVKSLTNAIESKDADRIKAATKVRDDLASKTNIVSPARGEEIATGKAMKSKSALAIVTTPNQFFTTHMIKVMLEEKLKHICSDPDRFIRLTPPKRTIPTSTPVQPELVTT